MRAVFWDHGSVLHFILTFGVTSRNHSSLDQTILHLLQLIGASAGIFVIHVSHALIGGQLETMSVSKGPAPRGKGTIVPDLNIFNLAIEHSNMMAGLSKLLVEHLERCKHLFITDDFHSWENSFGLVQWQRTNWIFSWRPGYLSGEGNRLTWTALTRWHYMMISQYSATWKPIQPIALLLWTAVFERNWSRLSQLKLRQGRDASMRYGTFRWPKIWF